MPRKMSGSAISRIDELIIATSIPSVVFDNATHLYLDPSEHRPHPSLLALYV